MKEHINVGTIGHVDKKTVVVIVGAGGKKCTLADALHESGLLMDNSDEDYSELFQPEIDCNGNLKKQNVPVFNRKENMKPNKKFANVKYGKQANYRFKR